MSRIHEKIIDLTTRRYFIVLQDGKDGWAKSSDEIDTAKGAAQLCKALNMDADSADEPHYMVELRPTGRIVKVGLE